MPFTAITTTTTARERLSVHTSADPPINRAPTAPMTPPPTATGGASPNPSSDLVVLDGPKNLAAWERQLAAIASGLSASQNLVSSPEQPAGADGISMDSPSSAEAPYSFSLRAIGPASSSTIDTLVARYKQEAAETSLRNAIAKTTCPSVFAWMLALGLSPSAGLPVSAQFAYARHAVRRIGDCGKAKMRPEDVTLLKMLVDRMEGLEREAIRAACLNTNYFHMMEAYVNKGLRNRVMAGDTLTEAWLLDRSRIKPEGNIDRPKGEFMEAPSSAACRHEGRGSVVSMTMPEPEPLVSRNGGVGGGDHGTGYRGRSERERDGQSHVGFSRTHVAGSGTKRTRSPPPDMESGKRVRH
ncbi:hypothetical protein F5X68DRAFT_227878 [Plectosphaerella plurivora]|uniref:Uncharacterized protein n=1 Tax=Plectosphaerella plurivora TaxID=936078 RepID=A0A9P8VIS5_9PEZI|nr:hypothetical protein F5X68DRAFT_227878 [Plectosphaerella plurivora]